MAEDKTKSWSADGQAQQQNLPRTPFRCVAPETPEQEEKDAQMIFRQITSAPAMTHQDAERLIWTVYAQDPTISRSGISRALKMLEQHYKQPRSEA